MQRAGIHIGLIASTTLGAMGCLGLKDSESAAGDASTGGGLGDAGWIDGKSSGGSTGLDATADGAESGSGGAPPTTKLTPKAKGELPPYAGDGYIGMPTSTCQGGVHEDGANCPDYACVAVGTDPPCGEQARYRAFFRFELAALGGSKPKSAVLHLYLLTKNDASAGAKLLQIGDFGSLENSDWDSTVKHDYSTFVTPSSPLDWIKQDVTVELSAELDAGSKAIAFMLQYENESSSVSSSHWYGFGCAEDAVVKPYIELTY